MNQTTIKTYCQLFFSASCIPISWYSQKDELLFSCPNNSPITYLPLHQANTEPSNPYLCVSASHVFYSRILLPSPHGYLCIGPVSSIRFTENLIRSCMKENAISIAKKEEVSNMLNSIPTMSYPHFFDQIALLFYSLTGKQANYEENTESFDKEQAAIITKEYVIASTNSKEMQQLHNTFYWEQELYHIIQTGDTKKLHAFLQNNEKTSGLNSGIMADTPLRQAKNLFIGTVTKVGTLAAIPGGIDIEQVYQMIDTYVQECEQQTTLHSIQTLYYSMLTDFTKLMSEKSIPKDLSMEIHICMTYIRSHTNEPIKIKDVAQQINRSTSYTINKFKEELGINIGAFIMRCRLEESRSLLAWSSMSLAEISDYLCFSSQSYFQNVFKKKYGITPMTYRKQHHI